MERLKIKKFFIALTIIIYLEMVYHIVIFKSFNLNNLYIIIFSILFTIFIDIITSLFTKRINKWMYIGIMLLLSIIFLAQFINYQFYGNVISIYSLFHGGQVFGFFSAIWAVIKENIITSILFVLPPILLIIFNKRLSFNKFNFKKVLIKIGCFIIVFLLSVLSLNLDQKDIYSAKNLYFTKHAPNHSVEVFGIITTLRLDIERTISNFQETPIEIVNDIIIEKEKEYNQLDIDFNSLEENETKEVIKNIHHYMANQSSSEKNEYTGLFKGKNLIVIVAEAFSPIAVDENLTPTLYKLVNNGFNFTNFYTPVYYVSTSDGEYVSLTSLLPSEKVWSFTKSSNNYLPYVYGNVFKNLGYTTYAFHDGTYKYYNRHLSHPNMGYTYMACGNGLEKLMHCKKWPQSDLEMIEATFDMYADSEHFMTYYMSISGHLEYNFPGNNMAYKNKDLTKDLSYSSAIKAYISCQSELDKALESLINKLDSKGILDDTVIVLSADHYPYGLTNKEIAEVMDIQDEKFDIHKNNLIIWNNQMETVTIDKYAMSLDILPTVLNLFDVSFDSRLLMGTDILSNSDGLVIFNDRSWISEYGKYNATNKKFTLFEGKTVSDDYVDEINAIVYNKYVISKNILDNNYYKYVFNTEDV